MNNTVKGAICAIIASVSYGTIPLGAMFLYKEGINTDSILFFRYILSIIILSGILLLKKESFRVTRGEFFTLMMLGAFFIASSITLFMSYKYMDVGVASTLLFVYPVIVAIIMSVFYKEKLTLKVAASILCALTGIALLYKGEDGVALSAMGVVLVLISAVTFAVYMVAVNRSKIQLSSLKMTFYVSIACVFWTAVHSFTSADYNIQMISSLSGWGWILFLAVVPTILSLVTLTIGLRTIGSTPVAIIGALEPLTAVVIGVLVFDESLTLRLVNGIVLILLSVIIILKKK
ncbi:MAG: EamA family transporter [Bacteroidia bacterium]|nr:EamA family transporter [Bacteroidia bacterium]